MQDPDNNGEEAQNISFHDDNNSKDGPKEQPSPDQDQEFNASFSGIGNISAPVAEASPKQEPECKLSPGFAGGAVENLPLSVNGEDSKRKEHKEAIVQLENVNTLAKYQLVFVKLQAAVSKLICMAKAQDVCRVQRAFEKFRGNVALVQNAQNYSARMLIEQMKTSLQNVTGIYSRKCKTHLLRFAERWRYSAARAKLVKELNKKAAASEEKHKKELATREHKIATLEQKTQQQNSEAAALKDSEKSLKQALKEKEEKERALREALEKAKKKDGEDKKLPKSVEERLMTLESHVASMEAENKELKERLDSTENNVGGFVQEMSELLDSHEFVKLKLEEYETNESQEVEDEGVMGGGTGGYSKAKNVPQKKAADNKGKKSQAGNPKYKL